jgi:hypothetical protein
MDTCPALPPGLESEMASYCTCSDPTDSCGACRAAERIESALLADARDLANVLAERAPDAIAAVLAGVFTLSTFGGRREAAFVASRPELQAVIDEAIREEVVARLRDEESADIAPAAEFMSAVTSLTGYRSAA